MALAWNTGLTLIDAADAVGSWLGFRHSGGGTPSPSVDTDVENQNTGCLALKVTGTTRDEGMWWDFGSGSEVDFTVALRHFGGWVNVASVGLLNSIANGGVYVIAGTTLTDWSKWYVGGNDTFVGKWERIWLDLTKIPSETAATAATISSIRYIGFGIKLNGAAKQDNFFVDRCDYGQPNLQAYADAAGNVDVDWQSYYDRDNLKANKYGIIDKVGTTFFLRGGITIGDDAQSGTVTWLDKSGATVEFENPQYHNGVALVSSIDESIYKISAEGASGQNTSITFGQVVGSGDDRQGISGGKIQTAGPPFSIDFETDIAHLSAVNFYGTTFKGAGISQFSGSTKTDLIGVIFEQCDEVQYNDSEFLNAFIIAPKPDRGIEVLSNSSAKQINFVAGSTGAQDVDRAWQVDESATPDAYVEMTDECNSAATGDVIPFPSAEAANDFFAIGYRCKFNSLSIDVGTAGAGGTPAVTWEYSTSSGWSALSGVTDGTSAFTNSGVNTVTYTIPTDWAAVSLQGETPLFYLRPRLTSVYTTTNPVLDEVDIVDPIEHHCHVPAHIPAGINFSAMKFFGFGAAGASKWHGENSETRQVITAGSFVVGETYEIDSIGSTDFTLIGAASNTVGIRFTATGAGSGTGTAAEVTQINATNGSTVAENEFENTGATAGEVRVTNAADLKTTFSNENGNKLQGIRVRYEESDGTLIAQGETDSNGIFTFSIEVSLLPLSNVGIIARLKPFEDFDTVVPTVPTTGFDIPITLAPDDAVNLP